MSEKKSKYKLSAEVAKAQVDVLLDYYDFETEDLPEAQKSVLDACIARLVKAIRLGRLQITDSESGIKVVQTLKKALDGNGVIEYSELSGKAKIAMGAGGDNDYQKIYCLLGSLSGIGTTGISMLKGADLSVAESLGFVFLQV